MRAGAGGAGGAGGDGGGTSPSLSIAACLPSIAIARYLLVAACIRSRRVVVLRCWRRVSLPSSLTAPARLQTSETRSDVVACRSPRQDRRAAPLPTTSCRLSFMSRLCPACCVTASFTATVQAAWLSAEDARLAAIRVRSPARVPMWRVCLVWSLARLNSSSAGTPLVFFKAFLGAGAA